MGLAETAVLPPDSAADATRLLKLPDTADLSTNDYHLHRRPGEVMIARWLAGSALARRRQTRRTEN